MLLGRNKIAMVAAEFLGTGVLTAVVLSVSKSNIGIPYFISLLAGITLVAVTLVFRQVSGAHFNPAITLALWSARRVKTLAALMYIAAQLLGGIVAYLLYTYFVNAHWPNTGHFESRLLVAEAVGAFVFSMGWAAAVYRKMETGKAAATIGLAYVVGIMIASVASGGMLNPAVALGTRTWVWGTYVLGPVLGTVIGVNLYALLFAPPEALLEAVPGTKEKPAAVAKPAPAKSVASKPKKK